jgi:hypothetical protein
VRRRHRVAGLLLAAGASLALAACGSSSAKSTPTSTPTTTTSTTTTTAPTATGTSSTGGEQSRARVGSRACAAGQVSVSVGRSNAGLGHLGEPLVFENVGSAACALSGYPGAALVGAGGRQVQARRTPNGYLGGLSQSSTVNPVVLLRPRQAASALLEGEDSTAAGGSCPTATALLVTPPNSTVTSRVARPLSMCDPQIHPVVSGALGTER